MRCNMLTIFIMWCDEQKARMGQGVACCSGSLGFMTLILLPQHKTMSQRTKTDIKHAISMNKSKTTRKRHRNATIWQVIFENEVKIP